MFSFFLFHSVRESHPQPPPPPSQKNKNVTKWRAESFLTFTNYLKSHHQRGPPPAFLSKRGDPREYHQPKKEGGK